MNDVFVINYHTHVHHIFTDYSNKPSNSLNALSCPPSFTLFVFVVDSSAQLHLGLNVFCARILMSTMSPEDMKTFRKDSYQAFQSAPLFVAAHEGNLEVRIQQHRLPDSGGCTHII